MREVIILKSDDPSWDDVLQLFPATDVYFERGYCQACASAEDAEARLYVYRRGDHVVFYPFLRRQILPGLDLYDIWSPYGYAGPLSNSRDPTLWQDSARAFDEYCRSTKVVTSFSRFHPLLGTQAVWASHLNHRFVRHTCFMDLSSRETIERNMTPECRNMIRKASRNGLRFEVSDLDASSDVFLELYRSTMARLGADPWYYFSAEYFRTLRSDLTEPPWVALVTSDGRACAAALLLRHKAFVHYHLSGWDTWYKKSAPNNLLVYSAAVLAAESGYKCLHLGGGWQGDDSLFHFKSEFNRRGQLEFTVGEWVHLGREFRDLCAEMGVVHSPGAFFPPYRKIIRQGCGVSCDSPSNG